MFFAERKELVIYFSRCFGLDDGSYIELVILLRSVTEGSHLSFLLRGVACRCELGSGSCFYSSLEEAICLGISIGNETGYFSIEEAIDEVASTGFEFIYKGEADDIGYGECLLSIVSFLVGAYYVEVVYYISIRIIWIDGVEWDAGERMACFEGRVFLLEGLCGSVNSE